MAVDMSDQEYLVSKSEFKDMIRRFESFKRRNGREPRIIYLDRLKRMYVGLAKFKEMLERWNIFILENGREPEYINVKPSAPPKSMQIGYWLRYADIDSFQPDVAKAKGCSDVFLSSKALKNPSHANNFISACHEQKIQVHAWTQCLYRNGVFISPDNPNNRARIKKEIERSLTLGFDGVHFDYIRYPGAAPSDGYKRITNLLYDLWSHAKSVERKAVVSAALMPEKQANSKYYGQCYKCMAPYLDVEIPMAYKGNYRAGRSWIADVTRYVVKESQRPVWTGLQTYRSDADPTPLPSSELEADIRAARDAGAQKTILFRYGLSVI
ncbi:MAG TPA: pseudomurein-binding repeat-containing protein [Thermosynergistes sp.]|nr:pseudomurein-binding repeat-containing protein [Thermosynergistes sp.]